MENDLTPFEKNLLNAINAANKTHYNYKNLMEWGTDKKTIEKNLMDGEIIYKVLGYYITIKPI